MNTHINALDYQQCVQNAALEFLKRHQAEHLGDLSALRKRAVIHLVENLDVAEPVATKLTDLAHIELLDLPKRQRSANS
ncbi:hypothetical protein FRT60_10125 [Pseudomonas haemolytica]|uniref:Uncharacterized protein n=1 Tax=Pseudomonas haemolytica TaxID=2600065 RepID=A0A646NVE6_9PSED|nr:MULTISPECIES: hypothetical protein [Pseudomonas]MBJ2283237.1 hypothetical protein [Pseudomonas sp. MF6755]MRJ20686.1 hypothetical protein [Pseudomonas haemolytica]